MYSQKLTWGWMITAALGLGICLAPSAHAQTRGGSVAKATAFYAPILSPLKQAHTLLEQANHDYQGHRVNAARDVHKAIHVLRTGKLPTKKTNPAVAKPKVGTGVGTVKEPQATSDAQMRQAASALQGALALLNNRPADARAMTALPLVQQAIREIEQALAVR
jgi:hypothetical protein